MESINLRRILAATGAAAVALLVALVVLSMTAPVPSYAEVTEDNVKVYEPSAAAACDDSGELSSTIHYGGYSDFHKQDMYEMRGLKWTDSYATSIKSSDEDEMLGEVMDELCGNPSALYATINGLQHVMHRSFNFNFLHSNPWAADYIKSANSHGLGHFMIEDRTTEEHRQVAAGVNTLLLRWENTGVVEQQVTIANWADISHGNILGDLPMPVQREKQEDLPALKLTLSAKDSGCVAAIGFNTSDKRFEMLDCATPGVTAAKPKPQEVTVVPTEKPDKPKDTPKEKPTAPKEKPDAPKETPAEEPTEEPEPTKEPTPEPTPTKEPTPTPTEEPPTEEPPTEEPPTEEPPTEEPPTEEPPTEEPPTEEPPTEEPPTEEPPTEEPPTEEPPTEPMPEPKSPDSDDYKQPGDGDERDSGEGTKPVVPEETEKPSDPKPVETEKVSEPDRNTGKTTSPKITDSPTKEPESESGLTAPGAEQEPDSDTGTDDSNTNTDQDNDSNESTDDQSLEDEASQEPEITQPTEDPDPVVVDDGPANGEEVVNPF